MKSKAPTRKQIIKKNDQIIKEAGRLYKKTVGRDKTKPKFEETKDYKILNRRKQKALNRLKHREHDLKRKVEARQRIKKAVETAEGHYTVIADWGPLFQVLSYAAGRNEVLWQHANNLRQPSQKYLGIIKIDGEPRHKYETIPGFFDAIESLFELARTVNSSAMAKISEYSQKNRLFVQFVEIQINGSDTGDIEDLLGEG